MPTRLRPSCAPVLLLRQLNCVVFKCDKTAKDIINRRLGGGVDDAATLCYRFFASQEGDMPWGRTVLAASPIGLWS